MKISKEVAERITAEIVDAFNDGYEQGKNDAHKKGEWIQSEIPSMDECSLCGNHKMRYQDFVKDRYCSFCGALMINGGKLNGRPD